MTGKYRNSADIPFATAGVSAATCTVNGVVYTVNMTGSGRIQGTVRDDVVHSGAGNDKVRGDAGNDIIEGQSGSDSIAGDAGNDSISGGPDFDSINAGIGTDSCTDSCTDLADMLISCEFSSN